MKETRIESRPCYHQFHQGENELLMLLHEDSVSKTKDMLLLAFIQSDRESAYLSLEHYCQNQQNEESASDTL